MDPITFGVLAVLGSAAAWKTGAFEKACDYLGLQGAKKLTWLTGDDARYSSLPDRLRYCDFFDDVIETQDGTLWAGLELQPVATDGFSNDELNDLAHKLNRCLTAMPEQSIVQVIMRQDNAPAEGQAVFDRVAKHTKDPALNLVMRSRARFLGREARDGAVIRRRFFVFIGRSAKKTKQRLSLGAVISSDPFLALERAEFERLRQEVLRAAEQFATCYHAAGGKAFLLPARVAFALAYEKLNPERAVIIPPPSYVTPTGTVYHSDIWAQPAHHMSALETPANGKRRPGGIEFDTLHEFLFASNPRETLCFTPVEVEQDHFWFGNRPVMTISLQKLPTSTCASLMEILTRRQGIAFPFDISASFQIDSQQRWDEKFEKMQDRINVALATMFHKDQAAMIKSGQVAALREQIRTGEERVGFYRLGITFSAADVPELLRRRDLIISILRTMQGLEAVAEQHTPFSEFLGTLPCHPEISFRKQPCLSHNAIGLSPLTGSAVGCEQIEAQDVFQKADGGLFYFNHHSTAFNSGMSMMVGTAGSGKSATLNRKRVTLAAHGYLGVTIDYGGSASRVCELLGGRKIDVADPNRVGGLGLFNIQVQPGEHYTAAELTPEGLPRDRLAFVCALLEMLSLDPTRPTEVGLPARHVSVLNEHIRKTYAQLCGITPTVDDFIRTLKLATREDREIGVELAARLQLYASDGVLGRFLNDRSEPLAVDCPYTVFDFLGVQRDPRLMLVATMAVTAFVDRFLRQDRAIPKFFDVDEFYVIANHPLNIKLIDTSIRTARKLNAIVTVASQDPEDFNTEMAKGIRSNCEVKWLFNLTNPQLAGEVLELPAGVVTLLEALPMNAGKGYRDCVLVYPPKASTYLRIKISPLDRRLLEGAGRETSTLRDAYDDIKALATQVPARLRRALEMDGLGQASSQNVVVANQKTGTPAELGMR